MTNTPSLVVSDVNLHIVDTLRQVVDVIGRTSASYLPDGAKSMVRAAILSLPNRWVSLIGPISVERSVFPAIGVTSKVGQRACGQA